MLNQKNYSILKVCCPQAEDHITFEYEDGAEYDGGDYNYDDYEGGAGPRKSGCV